MDPLLDAAATAGGHAPGPDLGLAHVPDHVHALVHPKGDQSKYMLHCLALLIKKANCFL